MANIWDTTGITNTTQPAQPFTPTPPSGNPFYNGGNYGQTQDWTNTPISENIREQEPRLAFGFYGNRLGIPENESNFSRWFYQTQFPRFQSAHGLAIQQNPLMTIDQFLATLPGLEQIRSQFLAGSPEARGARYPVYAPNARWINR